MKFVFRLEKVCARNAVGMNLKHVEEKSGVAERGDGIARENGPRWCFVKLNRHVREVYQVFSLSELYAREINVV